jgi:hypothetical protein
MKRIYSVVVTVFSVFFVFCCSTGCASNVDQLKKNILSMTKITNSSESTISQYQEKYFGETKKIQRVREFHLEKSDMDKLRAGNFDAVFDLYKIEKREISSDKNCFVFDLNGDRKSVARLFCSVYECDPKIMNQAMEKAGMQQQVRELFECDLEKSVCKVYQVQ